MTFEKAPQNATLPWKTLRHAVYLPPEYDTQQEKKWPLLIFLHGAGERGNDLEAIYRHGPFREIREGRDFPFVVIAPQIEEPRIWAGYTESLNAMLDGWLSEYRIDPDRVYLTGLSMGGTQTWMWGIENPERFAAIIPICGSSIYWAAGYLKDVPVWAFHGDQDTVVPYRESVHMVDKLQRMGGNVRFTPVLGAGHDCWTVTYHREDIYEWLLQQHK